MSEGGTGRPRGEHYEEAIARWQLRLQTEVKKASSLPTAMFDACDPSLEARLAQAAESIFAVLRKHGPPPGEEQEVAHLHLEQVREEELSALRDRLSEGSATPPPLGEGAPEELLGVLIDLCHCGERDARQQAAYLLCKHLDVTPAELEQLTGELTTALERCLGGRDPDADRLRDACSRVAFNVAPLVISKPEGNAA